MGSAQQITEGKLAGCWEAHWRDANGKSHEPRYDDKRRPFKTERAAKRYADTQEILRDRGEALINDKSTIAEVMREVLNDARADLAPASISQYEAWIRCFEAHPTFARRSAKTHLNGRTAQDVVTWLGRPKDAGGRGLGKSSVSSHIGWLRRTAKAAAAAKVISYETMLEISVVKRPRITRPRKIPMTNAQVRRIAAAMPEHWRAAVLVQAGLGLRIGELRGLREQDITWPIGVVGARPAREGAVHVDSQVRPDGTRDTTKSDGRGVPLSPRVAAVLRQHMDEWEPLTMDTGERRIFYAPYRADCREVLGTYARTLRQTAARVGADDPDWPAKRNGKRITSHSLRDHWICAQGARGVPVELIAEWAGDTEETILRSYLRAMPGQQRRGVDAIEETWAEGDAELDDECGETVGDDASG